MKGHYPVRIMADGKYFDCRQVVDNGVVQFYENDDGPVEIPEVHEMIILNRKFVPDPVPDEEAK